MVTNTSTAVAARAAGQEFAATAGRVDGIDVLRGLSILAVVIHHITLRIPLAKTPLGQMLPKGVVRDLSWNGYNGVIVFFAISGFLITTTCYRRWKSLGEIKLRQFYRMRFARIAPCLVALLAALSVLHLSGVAWYTIGPKASLPRALVAALTFHVNWLEAARGYLPANWDVLWSLSNEEMFYLFFPLIAVLVRTRARLVGVLAVFVVVGPFARTVLTKNELWADYGYLSCMDAIAIGCLAAMACEAVAFGTRLRRGMQAVGVALVVFVMLFRLTVGNVGLYKTGLNVTLLALGTSLLLICFTQGRERGSSATGVLRWFGRNSYEVYLTHMMAIFALLPLALRYDPTRRWAPLWYVAMIALAGLLGAAVARYFSEPMNRRLRRARAQ